MSDYKPISCQDYDKYEIAILQRRNLHLIWRDTNVIYDQVVTPLNLQTRNGEEFLLVRNANGDKFDVRLDRIRSSELR